MSRRIFDAILFAGGGRRPLQKGALVRCRVAGQVGFVADVVVVFVFFFFVGSNLRALFVGSNLRAQDLRLARVLS